MKQNYTIEALKFGFTMVFKKPIFFIGACIVTKITFLVGLGFSFLISLPYFIHLIGFIPKIVVRLKDLFFNYILGKFFGDTAETIFRTFGLDLFSRIDVPAVYTETIKEVAPKQMMGKVIGKNLLVDLAKGLGKTSETMERISEITQELRDIIQQIAANKFLFLFFFIGIILMLVCAKMVYDFVMLGWANMSLAWCDKKSASLKDLFVRPQLWLKYVIATLLFFVISIIPTLIYFWFYLLISYFVVIPQKVSYIAYAVAFLASWYLVLRLWFYPFYIIDTDVSAGKALQKSYELGLGFANVIIFFCACVLILGAPFGLFWFYPTVATLAVLLVFIMVMWMASWISCAYLYRKLRV